MINTDKNSIVSKIEDLEYNIQILDMALKNKANYKEQLDLQEAFQGLAHEIKFLMEERDKGVERIKKLENCFSVNDQYVKERIGEIEEGHDSRLIDLETAVSNLSQQTSVISLSQKTTNLTFGEAIEALKNGKRISRWNTDNIFVWFNDDNELRVKTFNSDNCPWLPNHTEILCEDWRVIE